MDNTIKVTLVGQTITQNSVGAESIVETLTEVYGLKSSITSSEWTNAGIRGINPEFRVEIYDFEYSGQTVVQIGSDRFGVYRTYSKSNSDRIELYLERKGGVSDVT